MFISFITCIFSEQNVWAKSTRSIRYCPTLMIWGVLTAHWMTRLRQMEIRNVRITYSPEF